MKSDNPLFRSSVLLNTTLPLVLGFFLFDSTTFMMFFSNHFLLSLPGKIFYLLLIPVRVCLCAGTYGVLVELASGEALVFTYARWEENARKYSLLFLALGSVPWLLAAFYFLCFPGLAWPPQLVAAQVNFILFWVLSYEIIRRKYGAWPMSWNKKNLSGTIMGQMVALYLSGLLVALLPVIIDQTTGIFSRGALFVSKYLMLWQFLFVVEIFLASRSDIRHRFQSERELILVNPAPPGVWMGLALTVTNPYPAVFVILKALTPKGYYVREYNRVVWRDRYYTHHKLVAVTCFTANSLEAYKIAKEFRRRGNVVVMGGPHVSFLPDEALAFCDSVVIGEAEGVWRQVVQDYEQGCLKSKYWAEGKDDFFAEIHEELLASSPSIIKDCLEFSRGCKFRCNFCAIPRGSQAKVRRKPIAQVVELLKKVRTRYAAIVFTDNNVYSDPKYARQLFEAIKPLKISWGSQCSIDMGQNEPLLKLAKESGCRSLLIGYEIATSSPEQQQGGKLSMARRYVELTKKFKQNGLGIKGHFIYGFDSDSLSSLWNMWQCALQILPTYTVVMLLTPFPGTALYQDLLRQHRLTNLNWRNYSTWGLVFQPKNFPGKTLVFIYPLFFLFMLLTTSRFGFFLMGLLALLPWLRMIFIGDFYK